MEGGWARAYRHLCGAGLNTLFDGRRNHDADHNVRQKWEVLCLTAYVRYVWPWLCLRDLVLSAFTTFDVLHNDDLYEDSEE